MSEESPEENSKKYEGRSVSKDDLKMMEYLYEVYVNITTKGTAPEEISRLVKSVREKKMPSDSELKTKVEDAYEALVSLANFLINRPKRLLKDESLDFRRKVCSARELYDNIYHENRDHCECDDGLEKDCADSS